MEFCRLCIRLTLEMIRQGVRLFRCTLSRLCKSRRIGARGRKSRSQVKEGGRKHFVGRGS